MLKNPLFPGTQTCTEALEQTPKFKAYVMSAESNFPYLKSRGPVTSPF